MKPQRNFIQRFIDNAKPAFFAKNTVGDNLKRVPLFNRGSISPRDFGGVELESEDYYVSYLYAAIRNRSNRMAQLATEHLKTRDLKTGEDSEIEHPYFELINKSPTFTDNFLYVALSSFFDLKGRNYLLMVRNYTEDTENEDGTINLGKIGETQEIKLLNPYNISRVVSGDGELGGYVETKGGMYRVIPKQQIIDMRTLNPFNLSKGYALVDAAKDAQYLNQQATAYTRNSIKHNSGQRGLINTDVILPDEEFANFKEAVESQSGVQGAGKFLYGNGPGAISYIDMQVDLDKLALDKINEVSREALFAVAGVSKSVLGVEQSGVTRETSKVQSDLFLQNQIMPQLQIVVDAFNQDYRNSYPDQYDKNPVEIYIDSPLKVDRESELKDAQIIKTKAETAKVLIDAGFEPSSVLEEVELEDIPFIGQPTKLVMPLGTQSANAHNHADHETEIVQNQFNEQLRAVIAGKQSTLETDIVNIQRKVFQASLKRITKNEITDQQADTVITKTDKKKLTEEIAIALALFYGAIIPLFATQTTKQRLKEFGMPSQFTMNKDIKALIEQKAKQTAASHMDTILTEIYDTARQAAEAGLSRPETVTMLTKTYTDDVSKTRARAIARTETNRAVAEAQYQADKQFVAQNELDGKVYKRWVTRSQNPCPYCIQLEKETAANPIPFSENFVDKGASVDAIFDLKSGKATRSYVADYESVGSGTLHPNCSCIYELIIK